MGVQIFLLPEVHGATPTWQSPLARHRQMARNFEGEAEIFRREGEISSTGRTSGAL